MKKIYNHFFYSPASSLSLGWARIWVSLFVYIFLNDFDYPFYPESVFYQKWTPNGLFQLMDGIVSKDWLELLFTCFNITLLLSIFGLGTRLMTFFSFILGFFLHGYFTSFSNEVYHHSQMAILALGILSLGPVNDSLSLDSLIFKRSFFNQDQKPQYRFPLALISLWVVLVYATSGYQKLLYGDGLMWAFSQNLRLKLHAAPRLAEFGEYLLKAPDVVLYFFSFVGLMVEVLAPLALLHSRIFLCFLALWVGFHFFVTHTIGGHVAFFSQCGCYMALTYFLVKDYDRRSMQTF